MGTEAFKAKDFSRLRELGSLSPGSYLVTATLKGELSPKEIIGLRHVAKWGWAQVQPNPLILLTGIELFSEMPGLHVWEDVGGARAEARKTYSHIF